MDLPEKHLHPNRVLQHMDVLELLKRAKKLLYSVKNLGVISDCSLRNAYLLVESLLQYDL